MTAGPIAERRSGRVLVLGFDDRSFLTVVRSLGRKGLAVDVGWVEPRTVASSSRYIADEVDLPPPDADDRWVGPFNRLVADRAYDLVVPCHDPDILPLQRHRARLAEPERVFLLDPETHRAGVDKILMNDIARRVGVPLPDEVVTADADEARRFGTRHGYPVIVKPRSSFRHDDLTRKHAVERADDGDALEATVRRLGALGPVALQSFHRGIGVGVEFLARDGTLLFAFQHRRVHEPLRGGGSSYRKSVPLSPDLLDATRAIVQATRYTGVGMAEFKLDADDGTAVFIELNARFWGSLPLAVAAGADFPRFLYEMWVEGRTSFPEGYRVGLYGRHLANDFGWMLDNLRADRSDPLLLTRPLGDVLGEVRHVLSGRERWDSLATDDPLPLVHEIGDVCGRVATRVANAVGSRIARSRSMRSRRRARLVRRLRTARTVLFVCRGNICRSPFAEALARKRLGGSLAVRSSGTYPEVGRRSPTEAIRAAERYGVDLRSHRSEVLDRAAADRADVVLVFDDRNRRDMRAPEYGLSGRVFFLADLDPSGSPEVRDPYGRGDEAFRESYRQIDRLVDRLVAALQEPDPR